MALNEAARHLNTAEALLNRANDETKKGGNLALVQPLVALANGYARLAEVKQQRSS